MATVPLTFRVSPIPPTFNGDINAFAQALAARLRADSGAEISFFASGTTLPTSDVGPFWKEDTREWYGWDSGSGTYIAQAIDPTSRGYVAQVSPGPDQNDYVFWIEIDGTGKAKSIRYYSGGAWKDVYEDKFAQYSTTAQMNAAIAAATGGVAATVAPLYATAAAQSVTADGVAVKLEFDTAVIDPQSTLDPVDFDYTAPETGVYEVSCRAQIDNDDATASAVEINLGIYVNNVLQVSGGGTSVASPPGARWYPVVPGQFVSLAANDVLDVRISVSDGVGTGAVTVTTAGLSVKKIA
jgi:hypothetical protein